MMVFLCYSTVYSINLLFICILSFLHHFKSTQALVGTGLPVFLERLRNSTFNLRDRIVASPATISTIVNIQKNVANVSRSTPINKPLMKVCWHQQHHFKSFLNTPFKDIIILIYYYTLNSWIREHTASFLLGFQ